MNRDDIMRLAREAEIFLPLWEDELDPYVDPPYAHTMLVIPPLLERFAALVAAAEREACAKVCDGKVDAEYATGKVDHNEMSWSMACAIAIRARGEKP